MKKIIALAIAVLMLATLAVPAFAATITTEQSGDVTVTYEVSENYTITIPGDVDFGDEMTVSVVGNVENAVTVSVVSENGWELGDKAYSLKSGAQFDQDVTTSAVLVSDTGATVNSSIVFKTVWTDGAPAAAGTYTDKLTFSAAQ